MPTIRRIGTDIPSQRVYAGIRPLLRQNIGRIDREEAKTINIEDLTDNASGDYEQAAGFDCGILGSEEVSKEGDTNIGKGSATILIFRNSIKSHVNNFKPEIGDEIYFCNKKYKVNRVTHDSMLVRYKCYVSHIEDIEEDFRPYVMPTTAFFDPSFFDPTFFQTQASR